MNKRPQRGQIINKYEFGSRRVPPISSLAVIFPGILIGVDGVLGKPAPKSHLTS